MRFTPSSTGKRTARLAVRGTLLLVLSIAGAVVATFLGSSSFVALCTTVAVLILLSIIAQRFAPVIELSALRASPAPAMVGEKVSFTPIFTRDHSNWEVGLIPDPALVAIFDIWKGKSGFEIWLSNHGVFTLGTLTATRNDIFGFTKTRIRWQIAGEFVVYPEIFDVTLPPPPALHGGSTRRVTSSEDDAVLRPYVPGDEIRRVHWPATARQGELMVRSDASAESQRLDLIIDTAPLPEALGPGQPLISAAASLGCAALAQRWSVRVITADGAGMDSLPTFTHRDEFLNFVIRLSSSPRGDLARAVRAHGTANPTAAFFGSDRHSVQQAVFNLRHPVAISVFSPPGASSSRVKSSVPIIEFADMAGFVHEWSEIYGGGK